MKLQQIVENEEASEYALIIKVIKTLGLTAALKNRTKHMVEDTVRATTLAIRNGVKAGYWNYVAQGAGAAKINGDVQMLSWALTNMTGKNAHELPFIKRMAQEVTTINSSMDDLNGLLKGMEATQLCLSEIAKKIKSGDLQSLERKIAVAALKKLGVADYFGVADEA